SANNVTYVVTAVDDEKITVDASIKRTEGTKTAVISKEITLMTSTADETAVIDVTSVALAAGKYTSLTDV
ncbi:hypothetical protein IAI17_44410, partial [Escherichia coli]|nr:hypothetical protein [Escherichia coli]